VAKGYAAVEDALCIGVEDVTWGQVPQLYVVTKSNYNETQFRDFLNANLAKYKQPKVIEMVASLPYTSTGKLQRSYYR
ncbi:2-succinylbenzoate-CoA ligase, partial [Staphylococcus argensis]